MTKIRIGITDHSPPPFEVEREALGADAEMVFLDSRQEQDYDCLLYTSDAADE